MEVKTKEIISQYHDNKEIYEELKEKGIKYQ